MKVVIALPLVVLLEGCAADPLKCPSAVVVREPFVHKLADIAGPRAQECGFVPVGVDASGALTCANKMLKDKKPFFVAVQLQGIDSYIWSGVVADAAGELSRVQFDSDTRGSICYNPRITVTRCASVAFPTQGAGGFQCSET